MLVGLAVPQDPIHQPHIAEHASPAARYCSSCPRGSSFVPRGFPGPPLPCKRGSTRIIELLGLEKPFILASCPPPKDVSWHRWMPRATFLQQQPHRWEASSGSLHRQDPHWKCSLTMLTTWITFKWHLHPVQGSISPQRWASASTCFAPGPQHLHQQSSPSTSCTCIQRASQRGYPHWRIISFTIASSMNFWGLALQAALGRLSYEFHCREINLQEGS